MGSTIARYLALLTGMGASVLMMGCVKDLSPVMPSWDVNLTLPLINRTYTVAQLVDKDTTLLRRGAGNELSLVTESDVRPTCLGNSISLAPRNTTASMKLGVFGVSMQPLLSPITVSALPPGALVPIRDTTLAGPTLFDTISTFESVSLVEGTMTLTVRNNLPVSVDVVEPVYLIDDAPSIVAIFEFTPTQIPPNSSRSAQSNLASKTIGSPQVVGNVVSITGLMMHIHGSVTPVRVPYGDMMAATLTASGLKARRAVNVLLPAQRLIESDTSHLKFSDSTMIQEMMIGSGDVSMTMHSSVDIDMVFKYRFEELYRPDGGTFAQYEDSVFLSRHGSATRLLNLAGYRIRSSSGSLLSSLEAIGTVIIPISGSQPITLDDTDKVRIDMTYRSPLVADSAVGVVQPTWMSVNTVVPLGLKHIPAHLKAQLNIPSASLSLGTQSAVGFPVDAFLRLAAPTTRGDTVALQVPASQRRVYPGAGVVQFDAGPVGEFLSQISGSFPDSILITGSALINPPDVYNPSPAGVGSVGRNDGISGKMELRIPLSLGIANGSYADTVVLGDTSGVGRKDFIPDKKSLNNVTSGRMHVEIENGMALQVDVGLELLDGARHSLLTLPRPGQTIRVASAQVDELGNVIVPARSTIVLDLTGTEVHQFVPAEYLSYSVSFVTTPGRATVKIKTSDAISLRIWSDLSYRVE